MAITKSEFDDIEKINPISTLISINDFVDKSDRTLLFGYTVERNDFHVYILDRKINILVSNDNACLYHTSREGDFYPDNFIPSKRIYPESMDKEFFLLLRRMNVAMMFTTYSETRYGQIKNKKFHDLIII